MPISALALALASAFVHATWNLLIARERDTRVVTAVAMLVGVIALAPAAVATWRVHSAAIPYLAGSAAFELAYFALLALAYASAEMSAVYPLARGSAPVLVLIGGAIALGSSPSFVQTLGVLLVAAGVLGVRGAKRGGGTRLALAVGVCIAAYTILDKQGLRHASPLAYLELVLVVPALLYAFALRHRLRPALRPPVALAGIGMMGAYALALAALRLAAPAPVAAVRETSVVIGVALGAMFLHERVGRARYAGAVAIAAGIAAIAVG
jgi:drug/metabolite transporter (DMT)-like permease